MIFQSWRDVMMGLAAVLLAGVALAVNGCATPGPSKDRLKVLLSEARIENRECHRMLHEYEAALTKAAPKANHPAQAFGTLSPDEGGF